MPNFVVALLELYRPRLPSGQGLVEYALLIVLVAGAAVLALTLLGDTIGIAFNDIAAVVSPSDGGIAGAASPSHTGATTGGQAASHPGSRPHHGQGWLHHFGAAGPPHKP